MPTCRHTHNHRDAQPHTRTHIHRESERRSVYVCVYTCVHVCIYTCMYIHLYIHFGRIAAAVVPRTYIDICKYTYVYIKVYTHGYILEGCRCSAQHTNINIGWLRLVGSLKSQVSFAEYRLFSRALLQKSPTGLFSFIGLFCKRSF